MRNSLIIYLTSKLTHVCSRTAAFAPANLRVQPEAPDVTPIVRTDGDDDDLIQNLNEFPDSDLFRMCAAAQCDIVAGFDVVTLTMSREAGCSLGFIRFASLLCSGFDVALEFVTRFDEDSIVEPAAWSEYDVKNLTLRLDHYSAHSPTALYVFLHSGLYKLQLMELFSVWS